MSQTPSTLSLNPTGYFIHDSLDIIFNHQSRSSWEYLVHHAMVSTAWAGEGPAQAPGLSPYAFREPQWDKPEPFPPPRPGCQVGNKVRAAGGAGHLPALAARQAAARAEPKAGPSSLQQGGVTGPRGNWLSGLVFPWPR